MFVCLAGYLDMLAFPTKFINVDFKAGIFISETYKKINNTPIIFKFVFLTDGDNSVLKSVSFSSI